MLSYPVWFPPFTYRGADPKKRAKAADKNHVIRQVSKYVNEIGIKQVEPVHRYLYRDIAETLRLDYDEVRTLCMVDAGHNGFMVLRPGLTMDEAFAEAEERAKPVG